MKMALKYQTVRQGKNHDSKAGEYIKIKGDIWEIIEAKTKRNRISYDISDVYMVVEKREKNIEDHVRISSDLSKIIERIDVTIIE